MVRGLSILLDIHLMKYSVSTETVTGTVTKGSGTYLHKSFIVIRHSECIGRYQHCLHSHNLLANHIYGP